jgi:hypothetical protein
MRDFLNAHANLFLDENVGDHKYLKYLQVINPQYEPLLIEIKARINDGYDKAYYKEKLSNDLKVYISPWLTVPATAPVFGRKLRKSGIIKFIEELPYIDYIDIVSFKVKKEGNELGENIAPNTDHGILTTTAIHSVITL